MAGRRSNGEGTIYHHNGRLCAQIRVHGKRYTRYGDDRAELLAWLRAKASETPLEHGLDPRTTTLGQWLDRWYELREPDWRPASLITMRGILGTCSPIAHVPLAQITPIRLQSFFSELAARGLSASYRGDVRATLSSAFNDGIRWRVLRENPVRETRPISGRKARGKLPVWSLEQLRTFLAAETHLGRSAFWRLALSTAARPGELRALRWTDLDLERGRVTIARTLAQNRQHEGPTKTSESREIPLRRWAVDALQEWRSAQQIERQDAGERWQDGNFVFTMADGRPWAGSSLRFWFHGTREAAGLPYVRPYSLRHAAATILLGDRVPMKVVQELLGHTSIQMTMDIYARITPDLTDAAADSLERILGERTA